MPAFEPKLRSPADLGQWQRAHQMVEADQPWLTRPWQVDLANGVEQAWREHAPLALWFGDGHPFGAADAQALALRPAWHEASVRAATRDFVLVADDWNELSEARGSTPALDRWLTRLESAAPIRPGSITFAASDGTPLGSTLARTAEELVVAFAEASAAWAEHADADSAPPSPPERPGPLPRFHRLADALPLEGVVLEGVHRACEDPASGPPEWLDTSWNRDWFWIAPGQTEIFRPQGEGMGKNVELPQELAVPLAAWMLTDASGGRGASFTAEEIQRAWIQVEPRAIRRGMRACQLRGELVAERGGSWEAKEAGPFVAGDWQPTESGGLRARAKLYGWLETDVASGAVLSLQIVALVQSADTSGLRHHLAFLRRMDPLHDDARLAPSQSSTALRVAAHDASGALPRGYRMLYAESEPELDGSLDESVWRGSPWTEDFGDGARAKFLWSSELLFLGIWSSQETIELRAQGITLTIGADGVVSGPAKARAVVREHADGRVFEIAVPWAALTRAEGLPVPSTGELARVNLRAGGEVAAWWSNDAAGVATDARVLLLPHRVLSFSPGGFR